MPATEPVTLESRRSSTRMPHWGWFLSAAAVLTVGYVILSFWLPYNRAQEVRRWVESRGGYVMWEACVPEWLRNFVHEELGIDDIFDRVIGVEFAGTTITDADLLRLKGLGNLKELGLKGTAVTD